MKSSSDGRLMVIVEDGQSFSRSFAKIMVLLLGVDYLLRLMALPQ